MAIVGLIEEVGGDDASGLSAGTQKGRECVRKKRGRVVFAC